MYLMINQIRRHTGELAKCRTTLPIPAKVFRGSSSLWLRSKACLYKWRLDTRITKYREKFLEPRWCCPNNFRISLWLSERLIDCQLKDSNQCHKKGNDALIIYKQTLNMGIPKHRSVDCTRENSSMRWVTMKSGKPRFRREFSAD